MSATTSRDYTLSVRLSPVEKAQLEQLAKRLDMDKSAAVRQAVTLALTGRRPLPAQGYFMAVGHGGFTLPIRLSRKDTGER